MKVFIVGAGRLGGALALKLLEAGHEVATVSQSEAGRRRAAKLGIPGEVFAPGEAKVVLLTVPDRLVGAAASGIAPELKKGQIIAHCSGALDLEPLRSIGRTDLHVGSLHPLCAVPSPLATLEGASAAIDGDQKAARALTRLAKDVGLRPFALPEKQRPLYHAAAAIASNGVVGLAAAAVDMLHGCGLSRKRALEAVVPLVASAVEGLTAKGLPDALTGPVARGDVEVVEKHLKALKKAKRHQQELYRALSRQIVAVALEMESGDPKGKKQVARLLK